MFLGACEQDEAPRSATLALFDISLSTRDKEIRDRYLENFELILDEIRESGGQLGADIIDDNPQAHGTLPINETFRSCTLLQNKIRCGNEIDERLEGVRREARTEFYRDFAKGTDIYGGLAIAESFYDAFPEADTRRLILFSDMVNSSSFIHFARKKVWDASAVSELVEESPPVDLQGVEVYVIGAGATAPDQLEAEEIEGMEEFWNEYFTEMGAEVVTYGSSLFRFP